MVGIAHRRDRRDSDGGDGLVAPEDTDARTAPEACVVCGGGRAEPLPLSPDGPDCEQDWHTAGEPVAAETQGAPAGPTVGQLIEEGIAHYMAKVGLPQINAGIQASMPTAENVAAQVVPIIQESLGTQIAELNESINARLAAVEGKGRRPDPPPHESYAGSGLDQAEAILAGAGATVSTEPEPKRAPAISGTPGEQVLGIVNSILGWAAEDPQRAANTFATFRGGQAPANKTGLQAAKEVWEKFPDEAQYVAESHMPGVYAVAGQAGEKGYQEGFAARGRMEAWRTGKGAGTVSPVSPRSGPISGTPPASPAPSTPTPSPAVSSAAPSAPPPNGTPPTVAASSGRADFTRGLIGGPDAN